MNLSIKSTILLIVVVASILLIIPNFPFIFNSVSQLMHVDPSIQEVKLAVPPPVNLKIPRINVDAIVEYVGLTKEGAVDAPKGPDNVAWFELSSPPGEEGTSIIDGHSGYKDRRPAVFDNLHKLKKGDKIYVEDSKGSVTTFVVRKLQSFGKNENVADVFVSEDSKSHLNLITCTGDWNALEKTRSKRLVVFTDRIIE